MAPTFERVALKQGRVRGQPCALAALQIVKQKTPADVQARIVEDIRRIGTADEIKAIWASNGANYGGMTQAQFASFVSAEVGRWAQVVKAAGAKLD